MLRADCAARIAFAAGKDMPAAASGHREVAVRTNHVFAFARKRAEQYAGGMPVKSALFSDDWVGFGIARLYESLMKQTPIDAQAFRDRANAAVWLGVPAEILKLEDKPGPPH